MKNTYTAHFFTKDNDFHVKQSVASHNSNVADLAASNSPISNITSIGWLCGMLHDAGKYSDDFQIYLNKIMKKEAVRKGSVDHSSAGGFLIEQLSPNTLLSQMVQVAVYCHHGLQDCISFGKGTILIEERLKKEDSRQMVKERYYEFVDEKALVEKYSQAHRDVTEMLEGIETFIYENYKEQGNIKTQKRDFFIGMYERALLSLLIDADRTDTACFEQQREPPRPMAKEEIWRIWDNGIETLESHLSNLETGSRLYKYRQEISRKCMEAGKNPNSLYRLTVPTGAGKTLSSFRFALYHAREYDKRHIIYVAPYQSILEQNAEEIREAVGNYDLVLEHHCNVVHEQESERERYDLLTENWDSPIIVTTAVQFLNTLFASGTGNIRRMHRILNSVIIFDEVQALPVRITRLFNMAVNFLTAFGKSTLVLCSATQPPLDELSKNKMLAPLEMTGDVELYAEAFKRVTLVDDTQKEAAGFSVNTLAAYIWEKFRQDKQILVIVNTKGCAKEVYERVKEENQSADCLLYHLSTNMCAENRTQVLKEMKVQLKDGRPLICVSTQLIEAGVDISFGCVIRSLSGLDSIIQAAGRCNREGRPEMGHVHIVKMSAEAENIERLEDIRKAQEAMRDVLRVFKSTPEKLENDLTSAKAITFYYRLYLGRRGGEMDYPECYKGLSVTLLDLLSGNRKICEGLKDSDKSRLQHIFLRQAFKIAGDLFEVIPEDGKIDVIVEYDETAKKQLAVLENDFLGVENKKQALRKLQPYTVGISPSMCANLGNAVRTLCDGAIGVLSEDYYSKETGVSEYPLQSSFLNY